MHCQIIVVGDSFNNTLGLIRSLGQAHFDVRLILVGNDRLFLSKSRYIRHGNYYRIDSLEECLPIIMRLVYDSHNSVILTSNDKAAEFIDDNEPCLSSVCLTPMRGGTLKRYLNKDVQCQLAIECGFDIPQTIVYNRRESLNIPFPFPVLLKPQNSNNGEKSDIHICYSRQELNEALDKESKCPQFVLQEYIDKDFEMNVIGFSWNGDVAISGGIKKIRHYPTIYSPCSYGRFIPLDAVSIPIDSIREFISRVGYNGPFSVEFLVKNNRYYFLEFNLRNDGLAYTATAAGVNLCKMINGTLSKNLPSAHSIWMMDLSTDFCHVKDGNITRMMWIKDFLHTKCQLNFNWKDPMPTVYYYINKLKSSFAK